MNYGKAGIPNRFIMVLFVMVAWLLVLTCFTTTIDNHFSCLCCHGMQLRKPLHQKTFESTRTATYGVLKLSLFNNRRERRDNNNRKSLELRIAQHREEVNARVQDTLAEQALAAADRRTLFRRLIVVIVGLGTAVPLTRTDAKSTPNYPSDSSSSSFSVRRQQLQLKLREPRAVINDCVEALQALLDNWEEAVIDCDYADIPRELLETKNKELLLQKASTSALLDKSVSVVSCRTTNSVVRGVLGRTAGAMPMGNLDKALKGAVDAVLSDDENAVTAGDAEVLVDAVENLQLALTRADAASYEARRDSSALNNFEPDDKDKALLSSSNLAEANGAILDSVLYLKEIEKVLAKITG